MEPYGFVHDVCGAPDFAHPGTAPEGQAFFLLMEAAALHAMPISDKFVVGSSSLIQILNAIPQTLAVAVVKRYVVPATIAKVQLLVLWGVRIFPIIRPSG